MTRSTMIHYVTGVTNWTYHAWNGNSVSFAITDLEKALERIAYGSIRLIDIGGIAKDALEADPEYGPISF